MNNKIYIVDVFAELQFSGNQLAVIINDNNLTDQQMLAIARETNYSETTFINPIIKDDNSYDVRIFTPLKEIPFAGHPVIGSAYVIANYLDTNIGNSLMLNLLAGQIPVNIHRHNNIIERLIMKQPSPKLGQIFDPEIISRVLSIAPEHIDKTFPIMEVSNGFSVIIAPLKTLDTLRQVKINRMEYDKLVANIEPKGILVFTKGSFSGVDNLSARFFADFYGIPEDPATGSANGSLAGYLIKTLYFGADNIDITVEQGYHMGRPSRLYLTAYEIASEIEVMVGGKVFGVLEGRLL